MNKYQAGNEYLPYRNSVPDRVRFANMEHRLAKYTDMAHFSNSIKSDDINHHLLFMGIETGSCGATGNMNKICPRYAYCTNNNTCQRINNYMDLAKTKNVLYRECMTGKDTHCVQDYTDNRAWLK